MINRRTLLKTCAQTSVVARTSVDPGCFALRAAHHVRIRASEARSSDEGGASAAPLPGGAQKPRDDEDHVVQIVLRVRRLKKREKKKGKKK